MGFCLLVQVDNLLGFWLVIGRLGCRLGLLAFLHFVDVLLGDHHVLHVLLHLEGLVDEGEHALREELGVFHQEARVDQAGIVQVLDQLGAVLIRFILSKNIVTSTILLSSWIMGWWGLISSIFLLRP